MNCRAARATLVLRRALPALFLCVAAVAAAADLSLFQHERLRGRQLLLREDTPDLADLGHLDGIGSLAVRAGRWEVCSEPAFKGHCAVFVAGEYPFINGRFNGRIASARRLPGP